jgi:hypothetical protein
MSKDAIILVTVVVVWPFADVSRAGRSTSKIKTFDPRMHETCEESCRASDIGHRTSDSFEFRTDSIAT